MAGTKLAGKKVLMVIAHTQFRDEEFFGPKKILEDDGATIVVASNSARTCYGMQGGVATAERAFADAKPDEFDALVLCGGSSVPDFFLNDKKLHELTASMAARREGDPV